MQVRKKYNDLYIPHYSVQKKRKNVIDITVEVAVMRTSCISICTIQRLEEERQTQRYRSVHHLSLIRCR